LKALQESEGNQSGILSPTKNGKQIRFADTTKSSNTMTSLMRKSTMGGEQQKRTKAILSDEHEQTQKFSSV
jgi:hypothetical protein